MFCVSVYLSVVFCSMDPRGLMTNNDDDEFGASSFRVVAPHFMQTFVYVHFMALLSVS